MRILASVLGVLGAFASFYLGLYAGMAAGDTISAPPAGLLWLVTPVLGLAGGLAVWVRPKLSHAALLCAAAVWIAFGAALVAANWGDALEGGHMVAIGLLVVVPALLLGVAAAAARTVHRRMTAAIGQGRP